MKKRQGKGRERRPGQKGRGRKRPRRLKRSKERSMGGHKEPGRERKFWKRGKVRKRGVDLLIQERAAGGTHMPKWVQVVVGELEFLEGDELPHPMSPRGRRVRVHVEAARHGGFRFARHRPRPRRGATRLDLAPRGAGCFTNRATAAEYETDLEMA